MTGKEPLSEIPCAFIYKKKIFLRDDEKEMADAVAKNLVYIQVSDDVSTWTAHVNVGTSKCN